MKTSEEEKAELQKILGDLFIVANVTNVNYKVDGLAGHPFTIGARHVADASDNHCGMLGEETLRKIPCAAKGCHRPHEAHTSDRVAFLKLKRNATNEEVSSLLKAALPCCKEADIDGFTFVETPERFRVAKPLATTIRDANEAERALGGFNRA